MTHLLSLLLAAPVLGAFVVCVAAGKGDGTAKRIAILASVGATTVALTLWFAYIPRGVEWQFTERIELIPSIGVSYAVGIDGLSLCFLLLTTAVSVLWLWSIEMPRRGRAGYVAALVLEAGLLGTYVSLDLLLKILFWSMAFVAGAALVAITDGSRRLAVGLAAAAVLSAALMVAGVQALDAHYHSLSSIHTLDIRAYHQLSVPAPLQTRVFLTFLPSLVFPFVVFVVLARTAIRGVAWVMLPGVLLLNLGVYGLLRDSLPILPEASRRLVPALLWIAIVAGGASAMASVLLRERRQSIANVSVAYAALAALGALTLTPDGLTGTIVQHVALTLSIAAIVLVEGRLGFVLLIGALSLAGLPWLAGFVGLRRTVEGVWSFNRVAAVILIATTLVSAVSLWRLYRQRSRRIPDAAPLPVKPLELSLAVIPAALSLWIGIYPPPLLSRIETAVARVVMRVSPQYAAEVADCLSQSAAPPPPIPGLPSGMVMMAPCADGEKLPPAVPVK